MQKFQVDLANQVEKGLTEVGQSFTEYGKRCVVNAIAAVILQAKAQNVDLKDVDQTTLKIALTNVGLTELNFNAIPAETFVEFRRFGSKWNVAIRPQGAGNEKLVRKFGVNVGDLKSPILVREGDDYELPGFDGVKMTPFTWKPKSLDKKVILVVYPLLKKDGTFEYLMATRDSIVPNIIAQIRQNHIKDDKALRDAFYEKLNKAFDGKTLDQIFADPAWAKELSNTYVSVGSREAMILRKMKNNALKYYPREFDSAAQAEAVKDMFEDKDESLNEKRDFVDADPVEKVEKEINEAPISENAPQDFKVTDEGEVVKEQPKAEVDEKNEPEDDYSDLF